MAYRNPLKTRVFGDISLCRRFLTAMSGLDDAIFMANIAAASDVPDR